MPPLPDEPLKEGWKRTEIGEFKFLSDGTEVGGWLCHACGGGKEPGEVLFNYGNSFIPPGGKGTPEMGLDLTVCLDCRLELVELLFREQVRMLRGKKMFSDIDGQTQIVIPANGAKLRREESVA